MLRKIALGKKSTVCFRLGLLLGLLGFNASVLQAQQEVTLHSGTKLVGEVSMSGDQITVDVNGAKIKLIFREVASIVPANSSVAEPAQQTPISRGANTSDGPEQLLLKSLESQLLSGSDRTRRADTTLLKEAYQLAPHNPAVAFWYARTLVGSGSGKTASKVLESHRQAIAIAYPERVEHLSERIQQRLALEKLPRQLVNRIDKFVASDGHPSSNRNNRIPVMAIFRLRDEQGVPLTQSAFRVRGSGNNSKLESFDEGYFLYTYEQYQNSRNTDCTLEVNQLEFRTSTFKFVGHSSQRTPSVKEFTVTRLKPSDKKSMRFLVLDSDGQPIGGAYVRLQPKNGSGSSSNYPSGTTQKDGKAHIKCFPGMYYLTVQAEGHMRLHKNLNVDAKKNVAMRVNLKKAIQGKIRITWQATGPALNGQTRSGESTLELNNAQNRNPQDHHLNWVKLVQIENQAYLTIQDPMHQGYTNMQLAPWVRMFAADKKQVTDIAAVDALAKPADKFLAILHNDIVKLKDKLPTPEFREHSPHQHFSVLTMPIKTGEIYVGQITSGMPSRMNKSQTLTFKIFVESISKE